MDISGIEATPGVQLGRTSDRDLPKPTKAYGFRAVSTFEPYDWENSRASSSRNKKANLRGYDFSAMVRYMTPSDIR